ncbi:MAG TPA: GNAT family N-acetyltransferase [Gemmataceae bacterium]|nr:GNAT family N-acetyltransferase [Gemmataceae bacterium]
MQKPLESRRARPDEWTQAFQLIFQHLRMEERQARVRNALRLLRQGELDPAGVTVLPSDHGLVGAMVCLPVAGASGLLWPPQACPGTAQQRIEDALLTSAIVWLRQRGAKLGQTLLAKDETHLASPLERHGFEHITSLWYMRHELDVRALPAKVSPEITFESYRSCDQAVFHRTLLRTYEGSKDCPEVNGVRSLQEIVDGHRAQGSHDPEHWWLAQQGNRAVGVLLVAEMPEWQGWDLSYLGVVPEARGSGVGRAMTQKVLHEARAAGASQVTLAVDTRNHPAWNLYLGLGFEPFDRREVYLAIWNNQP